MRADGGGKREQRCGQVSAQDWENDDARFEEWKFWKWDRCGYNMVRELLKTYHVPRRESTGGIKEGGRAVEGMHDIVYRATVL